ncbi:hypothetical protein BJ166DRAFT_497047 [Pestalotiopsis sp. NC0098]|nr:hypothetical protein BJ166DRAFT_497047 [Pestalotiopsis sp. NC0098]
MAFGTPALWVRIRNREFLAHLAGKLIDMRKDRYLPQRPRILTSQRQLDHRSSPADNRQEAPKPQRLAMPMQKSIPNNVSVNGNCQSLQTPRPSPVASSRKDTSPASIPTSEIEHLDAMIYSPQSHPIQNIELGSCDRPIIIPSTPRPKSRILQPASSLQVRQDTTSQEAGDDPDADTVANEPRSRATTQDNKILLLEICCRFEDEYLAREDHELDPNEPFWEKVLLTYNDEAYEPRYNGEADEPHFADWKSLRSRVIHIISKRYRLNMKERLIEPSRKPWRRARDAWIKVVARNKLHQDLNRLWGPFWQAFGDETRNEMNSVVEQQIKAHAVPTEEKLRKDWQRTRALVQKRCQEQLKRDSAKFNKAKKKQRRREKKQAKRKQKMRHDSEF